MKIWAVVLSALITLHCGFTIAARADEPRDVPDSAPLFCRDSNGVDQPFVRTNLGRLRKAFQRQFGWASSVYSTSGGAGYIVFSASGEPQSTERIIYDVLPKSGGLVLLGMKVRLAGRIENKVGSDMCWDSFAIVNVE